MNVTQMQLFGVFLGIKYLKCRRFHFFRSTEKQAIHLKSALLAMF